MKRKINMPAAVIFDFGDTLASLSPSRYEIFREALASSGIAVSDKAVKEAYRLTDFNSRYSSLTINTAGEKALFYEIYNAEIFRALGISSHFKKLYPRIRSAFRVKKHWEPVRYARHILRELKRHNIPLAIAANWDDDLERLTMRMGIRDFFSAIVASQGAGFEKPDPRIFTETIKKLRLSGRRGSILYVGNDYQLDVMGSRAAGCVPVLIDKEGHYPFADCARFATLREWFDSLRPGLRADK